MKYIQKIFISGLITFLPIAVTIYIVYAGFNIVENLLGNFLRQALPSEYYYPGFGFLATLVLIFFLGFLLNNLVTAGLLVRLQEKLTEVPLFKVVYSPLRDLMNLFSNGQKTNSLKKVVLVKVSEGKQVLGLVTREHFEGLNLNFLSDNTKLAVYIPMSYGLGGYTLLIEKSQLEPVDIPVEKAMSLALTAWIKTDYKQK
ncbi:MAG: DUF502 domain-containing protein [Bdellovibrio sp.]|nr:DUF502 domain-containing protein [Bdellovibrio sp.]